VSKECCLQIGNSACFAPIKELSMKQSMSFGIWPEVVFVQKQCKQLGSTKAIAM
jgi:hypothetical protein